MKFWGSQYESECNNNARAAQGKPQKLGGKAGAQWSAQASRRTRVRQAAPTLTARPRPRRPARACVLVHQGRPHPRPGMRPRRRGLTCERRAPRSAEQRAAGRPRAVPRPRLQPHSGAGRRTPLAAPRTGPPRAALYFRGGALATEDAAAGAATASGVTFSWLTCRPPAPWCGRASYEEEGGPSPGGSQPSGPRKEVEPDSGRQSHVRNWAPCLERPWSPLLLSFPICKVGTAGGADLAGRVSLGVILCPSRINQ